MMTRTFSLFATALVGASLFAGVAHAQVQAGSAGGVNGQAMIVKADYAPAQRKIGAQLGSGEPIYMGDQITTGDKSGMQVMLLDQTVLTLGQNARMTIDDLVYDPKTGDGKLNMKVAQGAFRYVSGKIALNNPQNVTIGLPVGTIGIRGTIVGGNVSEESSTVALLGPGPSRNGNEKVGAINVSNPQGSVDITRAGYATTLIPGQPPSPPQRLTLEQMIQLRQAGAKPPSDSKGQDSGSGNSGVSAAQASGESQASGATTATQTQTFQAASTSNNDVLTNASQQSVTSSSASTTSKLFWALAYGFDIYSPTSYSQYASLYTEYNTTEFGYTYDYTVSATDAGGGAYSSIGYTESYVSGGYHGSYSETYTHQGGTNPVYYHDSSLSLVGWENGAVLHSYTSGGYSSSPTTASLVGTGVPLLVGTYLPSSSLPTSGLAYFTLNAATPAYGYNAAQGTVQYANATVTFDHTSTTYPTISMNIGVNIPSDRIYNISAGYMKINGAGAFDSTNTTSSNTVGHATVTTLGLCGASCSAKVAGGFTSLNTIGAVYSFGNSTSMGVAGGVVLKPGGAP